MQIATRGLDCRHATTKHNSVQRSSRRLPLMPLNTSQTTATSILPCRTAASNVQGLVLRVIPSFLWTRRRREAVYDADLRSWTGVRHPSKGCAAEVVSISSDVNALIRTLAMRSRRAEAEVGRGVSCTSSWGSNRRCQRELGMPMYSRGLPRYPGRHQCRHRNRCDL